MQSAGRQLDLVDRSGLITTAASIESPFERHERVMRASTEAGCGVDFREWLVENWAIWDEFCKLADLMRNKGRAYYSARAVLHVLRWHRHLKDSVDEEFKINNRWSAPMARTYNTLRDIEFFQEA